MLKVLVVEDDAPKLARIISVLKRAGIAEKDIMDARCSQQAKSWLRNNLCDLLILDLNIPKRLDDPPRLREGTELLKEISERGRYHKPTHVIGITQYVDAFRVAAPVFADALVPMFMYSRSDDTWQDKLARRIEYLIATKTEIPAEANIDHDFAVAIVTALEEPELASVLSLPWNWHQKTFEDDDTTYFVGHASGRKEVRIVAASSPFMGMPAASVLACKIIDRFRPRYLFNCGIAAGVRGRVELGDVIVADPSWDWGSGKVAVEQGRVMFFAAPYQILLREELRGKIRRLAADDAKLAAIRAAWPALKPATALSVRLGPLASGAPVLSDPDTFKRIQDQHRKIIGVEMEAYAVMAAAEFCRRPRPLAIALKSVCDFADSDKDDTGQAYAAYTSARCAQVLIEEFLYPES